MNSVLTLKDSDLISAGQTRQVYQHPEFENLCVKVLISEESKRVQRRECRYYRSLQRRNADFSMVAQMRGVVDTNRGQGVVFDLIKDFDGNVSKTLRHYLLKNEEPLTQLVIETIEAIKKNFYDNGIVFYDLNTSNILLQRVDEQTHRGVLIDGIAHKDFIPLCNYSVSFSRRKIKRAWNRKVKQWNQKYPGLKDKISLFETE